jgi:hypothetical protein
MPAGTQKSKPLISSREWKFIVALAVILLTLTAIPYAFGYISAPPDQQFMGFVFNVSDHTQYSLWYRELQSKFLAEDKFTPEPNEPAFFNLLWWTLGRIGLWTDLEFAQVYQIFRLFAGAIFICMVYQFCSLFFDEAWERKIACLVITCGSGLGWILVVLKYTLTKGELLFPLDVYRSGTNSFLTIMAFPHFAMANSLIIITLILVLRSYEKKQLRYSFAAALVALILGWQHAYDLIIIYAVMLVFAILETIKARKIAWHLVWTGIIVGLPSSSAAFHSLYLTTADPIWKEVLTQFGNAGVFTADPFHMLILVGLPFIIAVLTFSGFVPLQQRGHRELLLKTWFLVSFFLGYLPTDFQVHLTNCWQVPVGVLATTGIFSRIIPYLGSLVRRWDQDLFRRVLSVIFVIAVLPTSIYLLAWRVFDLNRHEYPYYLYQDDLDALVWLEENTLPSDVVLSALTVGQYIPALSGNKVFLGHWAETVDFFGKTEMVAKFFDDQTDDSDRLSTIRQFNVRYIFRGEEERILGTYDPGACPYFVQVFSAPRVQLFRVNLEAIQ